MKFNKINLLNTGGEKNCSIFELAKKISRFKFYDTKLVKVKIGKNINNENYIPNLVKAKKLGLKAKISLDMQIIDSLNYHYENKVTKSNCI